MKGLIILMVTVILVLLLLLMIRIVKYARVKKQNSMKWGTLLLLNWFMFELLGISLATTLLNIKLDFEFMMDNPWYAVLLQVFGIGCGFLGYFLTRKMMDRSIV
jgi:hypothetical protein